MSIGQPLIRPRFDVTSAIEVLAALLGDERDARAIVRGGMADEMTWLAALRSGVVSGTAAIAVDASPRWSREGDDALAAAFSPPRGLTYEIALAPSAQIHDGRFASNAWLQELPHPITKQTWGNAALVAPATAKQLGVEDGDGLEISTAAGQVVVPVLIVHGAAEGSITVELGYGQETATPIARHVGADAYVLRTDERLVFQARLDQSRPSSVSLVRRPHLQSMGVMSRRLRA